MPLRKREASSLITEANGEVMVTLTDEIAHKYCRLPEPGEFIWQQINGKNSIAEIISLCAEKLRL